jgi:hypothetical protein
MFLAGFWVLEAFFAIRETPPFSEDSSPIAWKFLSIENLGSGVTHGLYLLVDKSSVLENNISLLYYCHCWRKKKENYLARVVVGRVQGVARELDTASVVALHEEGILAAY